MNPLDGPLLAVQERINGACLRAGRSYSEVRLVGVTKGVEASRIRAAISLGLKDLGENYFQEAKIKIESIGTEATWHMIGHIQSNKVKYIPKLFTWVHSVDRKEIIEAIERSGTPVNILFEVNLSGETTKHGASMDELRRILENMNPLQYANPVGLMTMPPYNDNPEVSRPFFRKLRMALDAMNSEFSLQMKELSMGMSGDFEVAIEEGATMVRVGTAIFGER